MAIETGRLSWLRVPAPEEVTAGAKALWEQPLERLGFVPNVLRAYALRPRHLELWWAFYDELMRGESGLTKAQREMIAVVVSAANRCHYCIVSHSAALRKLTGDPVLVEQLATNYAYAEVAPKERAMLDFAVKLTEQSSRCREADVEALREAGWSDEEIMDIAQVAAMFNFTNRLASGLGWIPNEEYVGLGR
ncbi:MAG TPA: peroxidase-related enzyme [Gaiellaceae bacterium]|nr:peroxidase-related enzyme [Gaiellaceae bacterium]